MKSLIVRFISSSSWTLALPLAFLSFGAVTAFGELIPAERLTNWTAGVRTGVIGGIPTNRTRLIDVTRPPYNADKTGATNAQPAIQAAINAAGAGQVVYLPAGTYRVNASLSLGFNQGFSGKTLRGAGPGSTIIDNQADVAIYVGDNSGLSIPNPPITVSAGMARGSTTVTVSDASAITVGKTMMFGIQSDESIPVVSVYNFDVQTDQPMTRQIVHVVSKSGHKVTFFPPLFDDYGGGALQVRIYPIFILTTAIGLEDLTVDSHGTQAHCAIMSNTYGSWIKNCIFKNATNFTLTLTTSLNCEIRHSDISGTNTGSNGAGLLFNLNSSCLVEDNIIRNSFPLIEVNDGSSGNVFAYNYLTAPNGGLLDTNHQPHNQFNLYEGNAGGGIMSDGYFGSEAYLTIFRNYWSGGAYGFTLKRFTRKANFVGNFLHDFNAAEQGMPNIGNGDSSGEASLINGDPWRDWHMSGTLTTRTTDVSGEVTLASGRLFGGDLQVIRLVWGTNKDQSRMGLVHSISGNVAQFKEWFKSATPLPAVGTMMSISPGSYYASPNGSYQEKDLDVLATLVKKGNRYFGDNSFDSLGGDTLPDSLFRTSKPGWFNDLEWPPYDPVTPRTPSIEHIPAGYRFVHGVDPPGGPPTPSPTPGVTQESQRINLPPDHSASATPESERINPPSHDGPSATPEPQQKVQKKWSRSKKGKNWTGKKNPANETSETPAPMGKN